MAKQATRSSEKRNTKSRKMRDLPAKSLGARKAASVKGGKPKFQDINFTHAVDKSSPVLS